MSISQEYVYARRSFLLDFTGTEGREKALDVHQSGSIACCSLVLRTTPHHSAIGRQIRPTTVRTITLSPLTRRAIIRRCQTLKSDRNKRRHLGCSRDHSYRGELEDSRSEEPQSPVNSEDDIGAFMSRDDSDEGGDEGAADIEGSQTPCSRSSRQRPEGLGRRDGRLRQ